MLTLTSWNKDGVTTQTLDPRQKLSLETFKAAEGCVWLDAEGDNPGLAELLTQGLKLHPLAVEDILEDRPLPKVEDYGDYLYVVIHEVLYDPANLREMRTLEVDVVISAGCVMTHHRAPSKAIAAVRSELDRNSRPLQLGSAQLAHSLFDHLVDAYLPLIDAFDDRVDEVERMIVDRPSHQVVERIFQLKRTLGHLRRVAIHQRDVLQRLSRGEFKVIPPAALPFYRDVYDHFLRVNDLADSYRELLSGALDAHLSAMSNRLNEIMKTLTMVATLMLPLTFIVGVYGMNFEHMPELHWRYGYPFVGLLCAGVTVGMIAWFRHRRWM